MEPPDRAEDVVVHTITSDPRVAMETYWREVQSIEEEEEEEVEMEETEEERKSVDEEEAWLTEAGLSSLVTGSAPAEEATPPSTEALISTLTRQQAATVRRRLDRYNQTLKSRNRQPIRDVRDVFTQFQGDDEESAERGSDPCATESPPPPCRYHTSTKTIRRSKHPGRAPLPTLLFEDQLTPPAAHTCPATPPVTVSDSRRADWLLRDYPYSEGVAEHRRGGVCWDCLRFHADESGERPFVPVSPSEGLTWADDLSSRDLLSLGYITHIELSTFLLSLGVQIKRTHPLRRRLLRRDSGVFGVPLKFLLDGDRKSSPGIKVPLVLQKMLSVLESSLQTEGLLRVPGSAARLKYLRRELDRCFAGFDWSAVRQVEAAGLLKMFIRELPTPLLTHTHLASYRAVLGISSVFHQVQALQLLSLLLPEAHRETLRVLLVFLRAVVAHQDQNRMSLWNVSMVMAPNLFPAHRHQHGRRQLGGSKAPVLTAQEEMEEAVGGAYLVRLMITHQDLLWTVPNFLLTQVRHMTQASNQVWDSLARTRKKLLQRRRNSNWTQGAELCEGVIRVQAPLHSRVSMAVQLDGQTRARDVTAHFQGHSSSIRLYEVGGNIAERRLHPDCPLLDVYRVNPHCDWLIKP
ncbi:rho GTPase-activating protein 28 isoform X2 [Nelusetta ayraudi]|uniref:rho GTPase-activating protein 28 isoform X2 n=1 Tax=Nelusetta ayraudi TaxID=303726 RepID=UPI003F700F5F